RKFYLAWLADVPDGAIDGRSPDLAQGGKDLRSDAWHSLSHYVRKNDVAKRVECFEVDVPERARSGAKLAELRYRVLETGDQGALVEIELLTGRKHQIRAQFSHLGCPIVGDQKYDWDSRSGQKFEPYSIALHACRLEFEHPTRKEPLCFRSTPGEMWRGLPKEWRRRIND
ncbi:MAG: RNA pseudouridine synthase, partial [Planctomycetota bacterium]